MAQKQVLGFKPARDLNKSIMNIPSDNRIASIALNHAMILPHDANPKPDGIFGKDRHSSCSDLCALGQDERCA